MSVIIGDDGWEEEGRQSYQGALGGGLRCPEFLSRNLSEAMSDEADAIRQFRVQQNFIMLTVTT